MSVITRMEGRTGYVEIDNPPVNAIGREMRAGLRDAVHWAEAARLDRVILSGRGRAFAAGADAREFDAPPEAPHLPDVLNAIDQSAVPWIAAINGVALGGGAELAMACRMRIIAPGARIGLPEVTLGLIPGAGGTQRLPRLVGLRRALDMITRGAALDAAAALDARLVHAVDDDPIDAAFMVNSEELGCIVPTWELPSPPVEAAAIRAARDAVAQDAPGQIAPQRAIDVIAAGLDQPFHTALAGERAAFLDLRGSDHARALRHVFFAERAARRGQTAAGGPGVPGLAARLSARLFEAAESVLLQGSTPWDVDEAMVAFGFARGPFEAQDEIGLDAIPGGTRRGPVTMRMLELGKLGRKVGAGWYRYPGGGGKVDDPIVADLAIEEARFAGIARTELSDDEIRARLLLAMIGEAAAALEQGVAPSARDIDLASIHGPGFPRWRGGLLYFADSLGAAYIVDRLDVLGREDPALWSVGPLLRRCAETGARLSREAVQS